MKIGDDVFLLHTLNRPTMARAKIVKIGREYVTITAGRRFLRSDPRRKVVSSGYDVGRCYLTMDEYRDDVARSHAWEALRKGIMDVYSIPVGFTLTRIQEACSILRITIPEMAQIEDPKEI